MGHKV